MSSSTISSSAILKHLTDEMSAILGALVGGAKYGIKIRLPHALIMTLLFRRDLSSKQKIRSVAKLVLEHASNLAAFATIYKSILAAFKWSSRCLRQHPSGNDRELGRLFLRLIVDGPFSKGTHSLPASMAGHPERPYHSLIAGACGGYFVWGRYSSVNQQIVLYLTSRVLVGLAKRTWEHVHGKPHHEEQSSILQHPKTYPLLAAAVWGLVMVLFEESPHVLHRSLRASMDEIYRFQLSHLSSTVSENGDG
ncbi:Tim17/Tim22/Tim23/Pmp24 family protein [Nitzschia inconspicua]|uniref:Tim17/Tim22/Tim23/Pmp24 family protein n=1 Tax=Nitzschia inconspicua TaxID=303405 RepID=A0A9K3PTK1_9STRA|nr:Tim17/Tim22/Tim23/Pmp24 family protein [Nitzschia inconspicua]